MKSFPDMSPGIKRRNTYEQMRNAPLAGNPFNGHTLAGALEQLERITVVVPERCYVDRGYRGNGVKDCVVFISGQRRRVTPTIKRELRRRSAIEPVIGHMKEDGKLGRIG